MRAGIDIRVDAQADGRDFAQGAGNAIKEDGNKVVGVGFDNSDAIRNLIKSGSILCAMVQNPEVMGEMGMKCAAAVLGAGYTGPKLVDTGVTVTDKRL